MDGLLVILSVLAVALGVLSTSEATFGVGVIGVAGVLAIWARMAQASKQHQECLARLDQISKAVYETGLAANDKPE